MKELRVLSLGWGVQSWTLAAMSALGELPLPDAAVHADTTWEHEETYRFAREWTPWLEAHGVRVITVSDPCAREFPSAGSIYIPAFTRCRDGRVGRLRRACTDRWKVRPERRVLKALLEERGLAPEPGAVELWLGISLDEFHRMRDSDVAWIEHVYPLVDRRMRRGDCVLWLQKHGLPVPPKSSCVFCPYHSAEVWQALREGGRRDWETAVAVDRAIRDRVPSLTLYVHRAALPLEEAVREPRGTQLSLWEEETCDGGFCFV